MKAFKRVGRSYPPIEPADYLVKYPPRPVDLQRTNPDLFRAIYNDVYGYPMQPPISIAKVVAIYETFGCRNNKDPRGENAEVACVQVQKVADTPLPKQQPTMDNMMGLMFSFMQTMMKPSVQSRPCDDIQIDYCARRGRLAGVARDLASSPIDSEDTPPQDTPPRGPRDQGNIFAVCRQSTPARLSLQIPMSMTMKPLLPMIMCPRLH